MGWVAEGPTHPTQDPLTLMTLHERTLVATKESSTVPNLLSRDAILGAKDVKTQDVSVPEWGGVVRLRGLTGAERDKLESSLVETKGKNSRMNLINFRAKLVAATAVDDAGQKLFSEADVRALSEKSASALDHLASVASKLSGMSEEDVEELTESFD